MALSATRLKHEQELQETADMQRQAVEAEVDEPGLESERVDRCRVKAHTAELMTVPSVSLVFDGGGGYTPKQKKGEGRQWDSKKAWSEPTPPQWCAALSASVI